MGEHPEDEEDFYEEEIEVRFSVALGASSVIGRSPGLQVLQEGMVRLRQEEVGGVSKGRKAWSDRHTSKRFLLERKKKSLVAKKEKVDNKNPVLRQGFSEYLLECLLSLLAGTGGMCRIHTILSLPSVSTV